MESTVVGPQKDDFECALCMRLLYDPATLQCGHSFCRPCIGAALRHQNMNKCALCRAPLYSSTVLAPAIDLAKLLLQVFPGEYEARRIEEAAMQGKPSTGTAELPCFLLQNVLPNQVMVLHIFELRYRLMVRRCLEQSRRFGMARPEDNTVYVGTEVEILQSRELNEGRFLITIRGTRPFKVLSQGVQDDYMTCSVQFIEEEDPYASPPPDAAAHQATQGREQPPVAPGSQSQGGESTMSPSNATPPLLQATRQLCALYKEWKGILDKVGEEDDKFKNWLEEIWGELDKHVIVESKPNDVAFTAAGVCGVALVHLGYVPGEGSPNKFISHVYRAPDALSRVNIVLSALKAGAESARTCTRASPTLKLVREHFRASSLDEPQLS